ncbi:MAG: DUF3854 domain-containing protein [Acidobacteria bacterium]|nr:DUF3854 domain-containing protein [Acidobacteriota bacterium]
MRVSTGSKGPSRNGGNIHVHTEIPFVTTHQPLSKIQSSSLAPLEIRSAVFQELIRISPAANYTDELVTGPGGLLSRGLLKPHALAYGALPPTKEQRATLAALLSNFVRTRFTSYARLHSHAELGGIPGFWQEPSGAVHIWKPRNYFVPILVIPYRDANGLIQACQIRLHQNDLAPDEKRYRWLASPSERRGTGSGTPIHFTFAPQKLPAGATVVITEGALKADTLVRFRPKARVIATSGVSCSHDQIIEVARPYNTLIAFDADHRTNPQVCRQLARLIAQRIEDTRAHQQSVTTKVLTWHGPKGIDDAVRANVKLSTLSIVEWQATLENDALVAITKL